MGALRNFRAAKQENREVGNLNERPNRRSERPRPTEHYCAVKFQSPREVRNLNERTNRRSKRPKPKYARDRN